MHTELSLKQDQVVTLAREQGMQELLKPLSREIHLFDSYIAGTARLKDPAPLQSLKAGDKLTLRREDSRFDDNTIAILNEAGEKLGLIPEKDSVIFARLMDAGKLIIARVKEIEQHSGFQKIAIGIYLVDF